jgi:hypothetical protein
LISGVTVEIEMVIDKGATNVIVFLPGFDSLRARLTEKILVNCLCAVVEGKAGLPDRVIFRRFVEVIIRCAVILIKAQYR